MYKIVYLILIIVMIVTFFLLIYCIIKFILIYSGIPDETIINEWFKNNKFKNQNIHKQININGEFDIETLEKRIDEEEKKSLIYNEIEYQKKKNDLAQLKKEYIDLENLINTANIRIMSNKEKIDMLNI